MISKNEFLKKYGYSLDVFESTKLKWDELEKIYGDHEKRTKNLNSSGNLVFDYLRENPKVHSVKFRIKNPEHLIEKIIRKKVKDAKRDFSFANYKNEITDLIGIRVIHLYKEDWKDIFYQIKKNWELVEEPIAYIRKGDSESEFKAEKLKIEYHPDNYRSVHLNVCLTPTIGEKILAEIQIRTIFEEGWSEIDHQLRYPYERDNVLLSEYLKMFNRFAGGADELGSFIKKFAKAFEDDRMKFEKEKNEILKILEDVNAKLKNETKEKIRLQRVIRLFKSENDYEEKQKSKKSSKKNQFETRKIKLSTSTSNTIDQLEFLLNKGMGSSLLHMALGVSPMTVQRLLKSKDQKNEKKRKIPKKA